MGFVLWIIAVILAVVGVVQIFQHQILFGVILLIVAAGVGPGGWSFFKSKSAA